MFELNLTKGLIENILSLNLIALGKKTEKKKQILNILSNLRRNQSNKAWDLKSDTSFYFNNIFTDCNC